MLWMVPVCNENGTYGTEVTLIDGHTLFFPRYPKYLLHKMADAYLISLQAATALIHKCCGCRHNVPAPIGRKIVLVSLKTRKAPFTDAGSRGYAVNGLITGLESAGHNQTKVCLGEYHLIVLESITTVRRITWAGRQVAAEIERFWDTESFKNKIG
jgi:hypothetical protein